MALVRDSFNAPLARWWITQKKRQEKSCHRHWIGTLECNHATWPSKRDISIPSLKQHCGTSRLEAFSDSRHHPSFCPTHLLASRFKRSLSCSGETWNTERPVREPSNKNNGILRTWRCMCSGRANRGRFFKSSGANSCRDKLNFFIHMLACSASSFQHGNSVRGKGTCPKLWLVAVHLHRETCDQKHATPTPAPAPTIAFICFNTSPTTRSTTRPTT